MRLREKEVESITLIKLEGRGQGALPEIGSERTLRFGSEGAGNFTLMLLVKGSWSSTLGLGEKGSGSSTLMLGVQHNMCSLIHECVHRIAKHNRCQGVKGRGSSTYRLGEKG